MFREIGELSEERKAVVIAGNILFFGMLIASLSIPGIPVMTVVGMEAAGVAMEVIAGVTAKPKRAA